MSITVKREGDTVVLIGQPERIEYFSTILLAGANHTQWLRVDGDLITLRGYGRRITYRRLTNVDGEPSDNEFDAAELLADEDVQETTAS